MFGIESGCDWNGKYFSFIFLLIGVTSVILSQQGMGCASRFKENVVYVHIEPCYFYIIIWVLFLRLAYFYVLVIMQNLEECGYNTRQSLNLHKKILYASIGISICLKGFCSFSGSHQYVVPLLFMFP